MTASLDNPYRLRRWPIPTSIFFLTFLLVAATANDYGLTWDEPAYFHASNLHTEWLANFAKNPAEGDPAESLRDDAIKAAWRWDPYHVPHPPFSRIVSGLTKAAFFPLVDKFVAYRLAPALFFALLASVMYVWMKEIFDTTTAIVSALMLILIPNLFGFAHFAVTDMPLATMWFTTAYCFWRGLRDWKWSVALGLVWGFALSTKFPALLIPIPLILWAHLYYRNAYADNLFSMIFLSPLVMVALQPYLWHQPALRVLEFLYEGISRGYRPETNFPIFFLNEFYFTHNIPWYYPFFMIGVTTPETILALALLGVVLIPSVREQRPVIMLFLANVLFILFMGLLPGAVLHDGVRQLLSVLPFLAALGGGGFFLLVGWIKKASRRFNESGRIKHFQAKLIGVVSLLLLFPPALDLFLYHPYQLSYYNRLVGGIRGAYDRGLEVTYFMEAFTPDFLAYLNENLPHHATINASFANFMFQYYQKEGRLRPDIQITEKEKFNYYILLNRRSSITRRPRSVLDGAQAPYAAVSLAGVVLASVYKVNSAP